MAVVVDLVGIKSAIQTTLLAANTTTASPVYLSNGMSRKVAQVLKINPQHIQPQPSFFPMVTCYINSKNTQQMDIVVDQLTAKFKGEISVSVVGILWNDTYASVDKDPADDDINYLMENIELSLRADPNFGGKVLWQKPTQIEYYNQALDESTHLRAGVLTYNAQVFY